MPAFHHISLLTKDSHENVHFYTEILGMRFVKNTVNQDNHRMLKLIKMLQLLNRIHLRLILF